MKAKTKDERFMIALYEMANTSNDPFTECNKFKVGEKVGLREKPVESICNLLAQCNFIKKRGDENVVLTPHGLKLVETLISD